MPSSSQWVTFLVASILFIQVPGPSLLFTIGRALTVGRREALLSVLGNGLGLVAQVALVAVGLGAVVAASATAYTAVKLLGAAYVIWLGIQAIRHRADARLAMDASAPVRRGHPVRIGFTVGATNPKTIVFFVAFLPQFIVPTSPVVPQMTLLGVTFVVLAAANAAAYALLAGGARDVVRRPSVLRAVDRLGGTLLIAAGVWTALRRTA